jgi:hypothetical protein
MISLVGLKHGLFENRAPVFGIMRWLRLPLHGTPEKGRKDCPSAANMTVKGGEIEVMGDWAPGADRSKQEGVMGGTGKNEPPDKNNGKSTKPPPAPIEDGDIEDGDIATPKRDRNGDDDQPL